MPPSSYNPVNIQISYSLPAIDMQKEQSLVGILFNVMVGFIGGALLIKVVPRLIGGVLRSLGPILIKDLIAAVALGLLADKAADAVEHSDRRSTIVEP